VSSFARWPRLALKVLAVVAVAVVMALSLAHVLELPGKMRLSKEHYLAVQSIILDLRLAAWLSLSTFC
jgi:hypothetical protein